ncbi:MAG: hypothetical protein U0L84_04190 [Acutalibacteraceae bacterium]|nr:hypothetical protein [Acutalibacteraceae bacterium]
MKLKLWEVALYPLLAIIMFTSKIAMDLLPNMHLLGMFIVTYTIVFRIKALIPIYIFVFLAGIYGGFNPWWIPYLYIWTVLWGAVMLLPRNMPKKIAVPVYMAVCGLHGFLYGVLYAPAQALMFGLDFKGTVAWIISGIPFDAIHGVSNIIAGTMILPLATILKRAIKKI